MPHCATSTTCKTSMVANIKTIGKTLRYLNYKLLKISNV